jgi:hypothetical protein
LESRGGVIEGLEPTTDLDSERGSASALATLNQHQKFVRSAGFPTGHHGHLLVGAYLPVQLWLDDGVWRAKEDLIGIRALQDHSTDTVPQMGRRRLVGGDQFRPCVEKQVVAVRELQGWWASFDQIGVPAGLGGFQQRLWAGGERDEVRGVGDVDVVVAPK